MLMKKHIITQIWSVQGSIFRKRHEATQNKSKIEWEKQMYLVVFILVIGQGTCTYFYWHLHINLWFIHTVHALRSQNHAYRVINLCLAPSPGKHPTLIMLCRRECPTFHSKPFWWTLFSTLSLSFPLPISQKQPADRYLSFYFQWLTCSFKHTSRIMQGFSHPQSH